MCANTCNWKVWDLGSESILRFLTIDMKLWQNRREVLVPPPWSLGTVFCHCAQGQKFYLEHSRTLGCAFCWLWGAHLRWPWCQYFSKENITNNFNSLVLCLFDLIHVNNNSPIQDYVHPDDRTQPTFEMNPGFKPFTHLIYILYYVL